MNKYDTAFIKKYIEERREEIDTVDCGMREDWFWTAETVFENGEFSKEYAWGRKSITVAGIDGSTWATPTMEVCFKDGRTELVPCYFYDGHDAPVKQIEEQKRFTIATGGKEYE